MKLVDVYRVPNAALYLYALLLEREAKVNISHRVRPTASEHLAFMQLRPYAGWYFAQVGHDYVGSVYLTKEDEIGVFIFREHQGKGHGERAVKLLMKRHGPRRYLANVAPKNGPSHGLFRKLGARLIQHTYEL